MIIYNGEMDKTPYKNIFGKTMEELTASDKDVVYLDCDLMNSIGTHGLWKKNKVQAINCGISEANMMGIAGGLSAGGKKPYCHTFGPFASRRCFDQIYISIAYAGNSARVIGSDPGVTAAYNGGTHMPFEDMAMMRAIPHSTVIEITDGSMLAAILKMTKDRAGLTYIRTTRKGYPAVYSEDHPFTIGKGEVIREGGDVTIIAIGLMVSEAMKAADLLKAKGINARVVDMFTVKPLDTELVARCAKETGAIVTAENHNIIGGLGDAAGAALLESGIPATMSKVGVQDEFGSVGPQDYLQKFYGLTAEKIVEAAEKLVAQKK